MTLPPWRIGSPSFSWRNTSHASRRGDEAFDDPSEARCDALLAIGPRIHRQAACGAARIVSRTHAVSARARRRNSSRASDIGPWFVTTVRSSSQSGSL